MNSTDNRSAMPLPLLENYQDDTRKIEILRFELQFSSRISDAEIINAMNFAHDGSVGAVTGHISDKTAYIALHYRQEAESLSKESTGKLASQLCEMEEERKRLLYYVSLLNPRQKEVIERFYIERQPKETIAESLGIAVRTVDKIRKSAVDELIGMYAFSTGLRRD